MSDRLLADEELRSLISKYRGRFGRLPEYTPDVTPRDRAVAEAQNTKTRELTLKEVGEWLETLPAIKCFSDNLLTSIQIFITPEQLDSLKQRGEIPR